MGRSVRKAKRSAGSEGRVPAGRSRIACPRGPNSVLCPINVRRIRDNRVVGYVVAHLARPPGTGWSPGLLGEEPYGTGEDVALFGHLPELLAQLGYLLGLGADGAGALASVQFGSVDSAPHGGLGQVDLSGYVLTRLMAQGDHVSIELRADGSPMAPGQRLRN
jgi:hypothetical protein